MKKFFKNLFLSITVLATLTSCGWLFKTPRDDNNPSTYGATMKISYTMTASNWQVDSICTADGLPLLNQWITNTFTDFETGETIVKRMYIKEDGAVEMVYIVVGSNEPYEVTRRITE
jgi:hypothetical protein